MLIKEMTPTEYLARVKEGKPPLLLDVREPWERDIANVPGTYHIPMGEIPDRISELDPGAEIVVLCRSGGRSGRVTEFLQQNGFQAVWNLKGGILAWSDELDPSIPKY